MTDWLGLWMQAAGPAAEGGVGSSRKRAHPEPLTAEAAAAAAAAAALHASSPTDKIPLAGSGAARKLAVPLPQAVLGGLLGSVLPATAASQPAPAEASQQEPMQQQRQPGQSEQPAAPIKSMKVCYCCCCCCLLLPAAVWRGAQPPAQELSTAAPVSGRPKRLHRMTDWTLQMLSSPPWTCAWCSPHREILCLGLLRSTRRTGRFGS